jgi:hypothetical protein
MRFAVWYRRPHHRCGSTSAPTQRCHYAGRGSDSPISAPTVIRPTPRDTVASFRIGSGNPLGMYLICEHPNFLTRRDELQNLPDLQVKQARYRARHSACHAEGRGFEPLQPLSETPQMRGFLVVFVPVRRDRVNRQTFRRSRVRDPSAASRIPLNCTPFSISDVPNSDPGQTGEPALESVPDSFRKP